MIDPPCVPIEYSGGEDPALAVLLLDIVLGYGSHPDPAGALTESWLTRAEGTIRGGRLSVVASITGTIQDVQDMAAQRRKLEALDAVVMPSNRQAARLAGKYSGRGLPDERRLDAGHVLALFSGELKVVNLGLEALPKPCPPEAFRPSGGLEAAAGGARTFWTPGLRLPEPRREGSQRRSPETHPGGPAHDMGIGTALDEVPAWRGTLSYTRGPGDLGPWRSLRGAVIGGLLYEGWPRPRGGPDLAASGKIRFEPCHHHGAVGPMAGVMTASMPVWILENRAFGNRAYCP
jgi:hypothetical protein